MGSAFAKVVVAGARVRNHPRIPTEAPHRYSSLSSAGPFRTGGHVNSSQIIRVSKAARAAPRSGGGCAVPGQGGVRSTRHPVGGWGPGLGAGPLVTPLTCESAVYSLCIRCAPGGRPRFGHDSGRNERFRGHLGVAGRLRRVVVARRCTQHHLQRVMVETPPRAGPYPPPRTGPFFLPGRRPPVSTARTSSEGLRRGVARCARNEEFTGAPSWVVAWLRSFQGIRQAGRRPNHGCRILSGRHGAVRPGGPLHQPHRAVTARETRRRTGPRSAPVQGGPKGLRPPGPGPGSFTPSRPSVHSVAPRPLPRGYVLPW